jgi:hypothetical protein
MRNSKRIKIVAGGTAVLMGGGIAFAYWTSNGAGKGSASTGTDTPWAVTSDAASGGLLTPGGPTQTVAFHVKNNNTGVQRLQAVAVSVANADGSPWSSGSCDAADFSVGTPTFTSGDVASGATTDGTVTISMNNNNENQDDCRGLTVPLYFAAS